MDNQHQKIKGYRDLSQAEIDLMNEAKEKAAEVGALIDRISALNVQMVQDAFSANEHALADLHRDGCRWAAIAKTDLQKGFMALVRAVAKPQSF